MRIILLTVLSLSVFCPICGAEGLLGRAESVAYDSINNRYLVYSFNDGSIVSIDSDGNHSYFAEEIGQGGSNCIADGVMYFTSYDSVRGLDVNTGDEVFSAHVPGTIGYLDGITVDTSGNIYMVEPNAQKIHKIRIADQTASVFVGSGLPTSPQDVVFDVTHNRLYLASYATNAPVLGFNLPDNTPIVMAITSFGNHDGISTDGSGNVFVSAASEGAVYRYDSAFADLPEAIIGGLTWPTGSDYNPRDQILAIPTYYDSSITFLDISTDISITAYDIDEITGDGDGYGDPDEEFELFLTLHNARQAAKNVVAQISTDDPYLAIVSAVAAVTEELPWGGDASSSTALAFNTVGDCPDPHIAPIEVTVSADGDFSTVDTILFFIGDKKGFSDDMESGIGYWQHKPVDDNFGDEWHLETYRSHSGSSCWKAGGIESESYGNSMDGGLVTRPLLLATNSILSFWHWIDAETTSSISAKDGATVYISNGESGWTQIEPVGGYSHTFITNYQSPMPGGTPCFSGSSDWMQAEFDLSSYSGVIRIMLRFSTDASGTGEGWYVDDIAIAGDPDFMCGDANADEGVNVGDAVYLINYIFHDGPPPIPIEAADVNCDGGINIGDAVYLVNYVFKEGSPEPCASCK